MRTVLSRPSLLGAIFAVLVGLMVYLTMGNNSSPDAGVSVAIERVPVLVARTAIDLRSQITAADVEVIQLPAEAVHPMALTDVAQVENMYANAELIPGEQILNTDISERQGGGVLAQLIPEGHRALSIAVSDAMAAGGLVEPGDRVDLIATYEERKVGWSGGSVVVQNVEVLAISKLLLGADSEADNDNGRSSPTSLNATVTIAVTPYQSQLVAVAGQFGELHIVLRRPDETSSVATAPVALDVLVGR